MLHRYCRSLCLLLAREEADVIAILKPRTIYLRDPLSLTQNPGFHSNGLLLFHDLKEIEAVHDTEIGRNILLASNTITYDARMETQFFQNRRNGSKVLQCSVSDWEFKTENPHIYLLIPP